LSRPRIRQAVAAGAEKKAWLHARAALPHDRRKGEGLEDLRRMLSSRFDRSSQVPVAAATPA